MEEGQKQSRAKKIALKAAKFLGKDLPTEIKRKLNPKKQRELTERLMESAKKGDNAEINRLLNAGADVNARSKDKYVSGEDKYLNSEGATALMWAAWNGRTETCEFLIKKGADVNIKDKNGWNALSVAILAKNKNIIKLFLEKGAEVTAKNKRGFTELLLEAIEEERIDTARLLIENGADVNADNLTIYRKRTLLMWAAERGKTEICKLLIEKGADVDARSETGWTALKYAKNNSQSETVRLLEGYTFLNNLMGKEAARKFFYAFNECTGGR